jgi:hypothetical protein
MTTIDKARSVRTSSVKRGSRLSSRRLAVEVLKYGILIALTVTWLFPFYWMFTSALKDDSQVYTIPPVLIPNPAYWNNFADAWAKNDFNLFAFNSIFRYALPATLLTIISSAVVAYGFSRIKWPGRDTLFYVCLITIMLPWQVTLVPLFITFKNLGWLNSYLPLVVPNAFGSAFFLHLHDAAVLPDDSRGALGRGQDRRRERARNYAADYPAARGAGAGSGSAVPLPRRLERLPRPIDLPEQRAAVSFGPGYQPPPQQH